MWTGRRRWLDRERDCQASPRGRPARRGAALGRRRERAAAQGAERGAARARARQARRDGRGPAGRESRCRRAPGRADPRRLPLRIAAIAERRETLLKEVASAEAGRACRSQAGGRRPRGRGGAARGGRGQGAGPCPRGRQAKAAQRRRPMPSPPRRRRRQPSQRPISAPRGNPTTTIHSSSISGAAASALGRYSAGNFARLMDRMVADFIGFGDVRANYAALIEIPLRLREHATAKRAAATSADRPVGDRAARDGRGRHRPQGAGAGRGAPEARGGRQDGGGEAGRSCARSTRSAARWSPAAPTRPTTRRWRPSPLADSKDDLAALYQEARRTTDRARMMPSCAGSRPSRRRRQG